MFKLLSKVYRPLSYSVALWKHEKDRILIIDNVAMRELKLLNFTITRNRLTLSVEL